MRGIVCYHRVVGYICLALVERKSWQRGTGVNGRKSERGCLELGKGERSLLSGENIFA